MPAVNQILNEPLIYLSGPGPGASGNTDMRVAATAEDPSIFQWVNVSNFPAAIARMTGHMRCGNAFTLDKFGDLTALTNGVKVEASADGQTWFLLALLKTNSDIVDQTGDMTAIQMAGAGTTVPVNWRSDVDPVIVPPTGGIRVVIQDNLTGLQRLRARVGGAIIGAGFQGSVA